MNDRQDATRWKSIPSQIETQPAQRFPKSPVSLSLNRINQANQFLMATGIDRSRVSLPTRRLSYRLEFYADEHGVGKVMEFCASDLTDALKRIRGDRTRRIVDIWENGTLIGRVRHGPKGLRIKRALPPS